MNLNMNDVIKNVNGQYCVRYLPEVDTESLKGGGNLAVVKRKNTVKPFTFNLPMWLTPYLDEYIELCSDSKQRFLRNPVRSNKRSGLTVYAQNVGKNNFGEWGKEMAEFLEKDDPKLYTSHCWRRSGATNLANNGATELQLKRAGQWSSISSACAYLDDNENARKDQLSKLGGDDERDIVMDTIKLVTPEPNKIQVDSTTSNKLNSSSAVNGIANINSPGPGNVVVNNHFYYANAAAHQKNNME